MKMESTGCYYLSCVNSFIILLQLMTLHPTQKVQSLEISFDKNCLKHNLSIGCNLIEAQHSDNQKKKLNFLSKLLRPKRQVGETGSGKSSATSGGRMKRQNFLFSNGRLVTLPLCTTTTTLQSQVSVVTTPSTAPTPIPTTTPPPVTCRNNGVLSTNAKRTIVIEHNEARRRVDPPATNMRLMTWDDELAWLAARRTSRCAFKEHDAFARLQDGRSDIDIERHSVLDAEVGYNWFAWENTPDLPNRFIWDVMAGWVSEKKFYSHEDRTCSSVCRHYLQVIWARTYKIGCATSCCPSYNINGVIWRSATTLICAYAPRGNVLDYGIPPAPELSYPAPSRTRFPYFYGASCRECGVLFQSNMIYLKRGLVLPPNVGQPQGAIRSKKKRQAPITVDICQNRLCVNNNRDKPIPFIPNRYKTTKFSWKLAPTPPSIDATPNADCFQPNTLNGGGDASGGATKLNLQSSFLFVVLLYCSFFLFMYS